MSGARRRNVNVTPSSNHQPVGAEVRNEFYAQDDQTMRHHFLSLCGKHEQPTWKEFLFSMFVELWGTWLIGTAVALALWFCDNTNLQIEALFVALVYAVSYYTAVRSGMYAYKLRPHCSGAVTMGYLFTGEVGLPGALFYLGAQTLGNLIGGLTVGAFISGVPGSATKLPVPLPLLATSSMTTVVLFELFGSALIAFFLLLNEFHNTPGVSDSTVDGTAYASEANQDQLRKNHKKAVFKVALLTAVLVTLGYQFQVVTFSNVAYGAGLFSGITASSPDLKAFKPIASLHASDFPGSVWGTRNGAAAMYMLMPWAGGILGAAIFWGIFLLFAKDRSLKEGKDELDNKVALRYARAGAQVTGGGSVSAPIVATSVSHHPITGFAGPASGLKTQ